MIQRPLPFFILSIGLLSILGLLFLRLTYLKTIKHDYYLEKSKNQLSRTIKVFPRRGKILDRNKKVLADVIPSYDIYILPQKLTEIDQYLPRITDYLSLDHDSLKSYLLRTKATFFWLKRHCTPEEMKLIKSLKLPALGYIKTQSRYYPETKLGAQVLGFVGIDNQGLGGLEYLYDQRLKGTPGKIYMEGDPKGFPIMSGKLTRTPQYDGYHLVTTLDTFIQFSAQHHLSEGVSLNLAEKGQVIVMNPKTGEILAMAAYPSFNPNHWEDFPSRYRKNGTIVDVYEPGSIFKPVTIASALDAELVTPGTTLDVPETLQVYDRIISEAHRREATESSQKTVTDILVESLNVGTTLLAQKLGEARQYHYISKFGFGQKTNIGLPAESAGISRSPSSWSKVDTAMISFGQGIAVTSLQMIGAIASIANKGQYMQPHVVKYVSNSDFSTQKSHPITVKRQVIHPKIAQQVTEMMTAVVSSGTATSVQIPGYPIAGKTGTAQKAKLSGKGYEAGKYIASFVGFFPVDDPQFIILVSVDSPQKSIWGSRVAGPIFKNIATDLIQYARIPPQINL
jgi:cell division protein FtsI/penicillin-binding protein 2